MGKKYVVEIGRLERLYKASISAKGMPNMTWLSPEVDLTPYTEPDLEQVKKEAYDNGFDAGRMLNNGKYEKGINDAWEAARKIIRMPEVDLLNLFTECYSAVCTSLQVFLKYDASECIEKIKAWEDGKQEIKVGDEVGYYGVADEHGNVCYSGVVLEIREDDYFVMEKTGKTYALKKNLAQGKTGRHFPEIAAVLEKMRGESND